MSKEKKYIYDWFREKDLFKHKAFLIKSADGRRSIDPSKIIVK